jgi:hypothetical protein
MWWIQYVLVFGAAVLSSIGAFTGRARGFASLVGMFLWFVVGNASVAVEYYDATGVAHVAQSTALTWLSYGVAVIHVVVFIIALHAVLTDDDSGIDAPDELVDALDPAALNNDDSTPQFDTEQ